MSTRQLSLFDRPARPIEPCDPKVTATERPRLKGQNAVILARLESGPCSNRELATIALNYRARISDLRAAGYQIPPPIEDEVTGVAMYSLTRSENIV